METYSKIYGILEEKKEQLRGKKINVLFLDCDGVVNNMYQFRQSQGGIKIGRGGTVSLNNVIPTCDLFHWCMENNTYIVYSTAWNINGADRVTDTLSNFIAHKTLEKVVIGCTPYITGENNSRENEIAWVMEQMERLDIEVVKWIALDDAELKYEYEHFVKTDPEIGLIEHKVVECINKLGDEKKMWLRRE